MRALHTADLHQGLTRYGNPTPKGNSRLFDFGQTFARFVDTAIAEDVDLAIIAGDSFQTRREGPVERRMFVRELLRLTEACPAVLIDGNHDGRDTVGDPESGSLLWVAEVAVVQPPLHVFLKPVAGEVIRTKAGDVSVTAVPYPHKRAFDKLRPDLTTEERVQLAGGRMEGVIGAMHAQAKERNPGLPQLFIGHLSVGTMALGRTQPGSETTMRFTWDVAIRPEVLDVFDYAALGHIHRQQKVGQKGWYAGAPEYIDFGEEGLAKGFLLVDFDADRDPIVTSIDSRPRAMRTFVAKQSDTSWDLTTPVDRVVEVTDTDSLDGAIVQLLLYPRDRVRPEDIAMLERTLRGRGASYVKTKVIPPERPDVVRADVDPDLDPVEATRRQLVAMGTPEAAIPAVIEAARELLAQAA